jgi:hypothetical protein
MKYIKLWHLAFFAILAFVLIFFFRNVESRDLKEKGVLVNVEILEILTPSKGAGSFNFRCRFIYDGEQKILISPTSVKENGSRYIGKYCPALFSPKKNNLRVLLRVDDFKEYEVPLTDSLNEVINGIN